MTVFTDAERQYLAGQPLGRLATLGSDGAPQVRPLGYRYDVEAIGGQSYIRIAP